MRRLLPAAAVLAVLGSGCGGAAQTGAEPREPASSRVVDLEAGPPFVHGLDVDPATGDVLMSTNRGLWRIGADGTPVRRVRGRLRGAPVGAAITVAAAGPDRLLGSGHPDAEGPLPEFLGLIRSDDGGRSWRVVSGLGDFDLHKIVVRGDRSTATTPSRSRWSSPRTAGAASTGARPLRAS